MNNKFINNNGVNLHNTSKKQIKKTKVEIQIEKLKQQKQAINKELWNWETKQKKAERLTNYLEEVNQFSTKYLTEVVKTEKDKENHDDWRLEYYLEDKISFKLKFNPAKEAFYNLVFHKIENRIEYLKSQLRTIQEQLSRQERIFARIEMRRQGRFILPCKLNDRLGCLGSYQCDNCKVNYSVIADNQITEISK